MNYKQLEQDFLSKIGTLYEAEEAKAIYGMVIEYLTGFGRAEQVLHRADEVTAPLLAGYTSIVQGLENGKPIQHVFSEAWFYGLKFKVSPAVLIPRPETEELVHWILQSAAIDQSMQLIDIGTGSGCIAITLKKNAPALQVDALDVSEDALIIAAENAGSHQVDINFIHQDIFDYVTSKKYDIIVSNPPYIKDDEREAMHQNVLLHEPHLALFVSNDNPLIFYKQIADFAILNLNDEGRLFFEINEYLAEETMEMLSSKGFINIILKNDLQGKARMICGQYQR